MINKIILSIVLMVLVSGCNRRIVKDWEATGGSRADAVVKLSYQFHYGDTLELSEQQALSLAKRRCEIWGYTGAEAFGGVIRDCQRRDRLLGCIDTLVTKEYQCTGMGDSGS